MEIANNVALSHSSLLVHMDRNSYWHKAELAFPHADGPERRMQGPTPAAQAAVKDAVRKATGQEVLIHFSVRDTGIGISQENIARLFQSFSQVPHKLARPDTPDLFIAVHASLLKCPILVC